MGTSIVIQAFEVDLDDEASFLELLSEVESWRVDGSAEIKADSNPFDFILDPFGFPRFCFLLLSIYSLGLSVYILTQIREVARFYRDGPQNKWATMAFIMRMMILIPEFVGNLLGCLSFFNGLFLYNVFDYFVFLGWLTNFRATIMGITDVVVMFYCWDIYQIFKTRRSMKPFTPFLMKHRCGLQLLILIALAMIGLDRYTTYLTVRGAAGVTAVFGSVMVAVIYLIGIIVAGVTTSKINSELKQLDMANASVDYATNRGLRVLVKSVKMLRWYMLITSIGRLTCIIAISMLATSVVYRDPYVCFLTNLLCFGVGSLMSSTAQIHIAVATPAVRADIRLMSTPKPNAEVFPDDPSTAGAANICMT